MPDGTFYLIWASVDHVLAPEGVSKVPTVSALFLLDEDEESLHSSHG